MPRKLEDSWIKSNREYTRLRLGRLDGLSPTEQPERQAPGKGGHAKPDYGRWTTRELRAIGGTLGIDDAAQMERDELLRQIEQHESRAGLDD
jgi:hypothetical protein